MPHRIQWDITCKGDVKRGRVTHCLEISLDPSLIQLGLRGSTRPSLEICIPQASFQSDFVTTCTTHRGSFDAAWGHTVDDSTGQRRYAVEYLKLLQSITWDGEPVVLNVQITQGNVWTGERPAFAFNDLTITPAVDGNICIHLPVGGAWNKFWCKTFRVFRLDPFQLEKERYPQKDSSDSHQFNDDRDEVNVPLSATSYPKLSIRVVCHFTWAYNLIRTKKPLSVVVAVLALLLVVAWRLKWLKAVGDFAAYRFNQEP